MLVSIVVDLCLTIFSVAAAHAIVYVPAAGWGALTNGGLIASSLFYAVAVTIGMASMGLYDARQRYGVEGALVRMLIGVFIGALITSLFVFLLAFDESRRTWLLAILFAVLLLGLARILFDRYRDDEVFRRRVLVCGAGRMAASILQLRRRSDQRGFLIVGFLPSDGDETRINDPRVIEHSPLSLKEIVETQSIDEIVIAVDDRRRGFPLTDLFACKLSGIRITDLLEFLERESGRVMVDLMNPSWLIYSESFNRRNRKRASFRILDLSISVLVLAVAWPVMLVIAALILLDDGTPAMYRQTRVGLNGRNFTLMKFRSMRKDAEAHGSPVWATVDDARVTRIGAWLRKLRLDELPQIFNVIRGDMSLVGPRPERPEFVESLAKKIPYYHERHYVKPGITGWAQLCYPYGASEKDALAKLEFDMYYIKNRSVIFYLIILLQTAEVIFWRKGSR